MSGEDDAPEERERVLERIGAVILEFRNAMAGRPWHMEDLRRFVCDAVPPCAPESPGRCLRQLRQNGVLHYVVVDRGQSLYRFASVGELYSESLLVRVRGITPKGQEFTAGMLVDAVTQCVVFAAPILSHLVGQHRDKLRKTFARLGWRASIVPRACDSDRAAA